MVLRCPVDEHGNVTVPTGNILGRLTISLPDALQSTVQSSMIEMQVTLKIDGVPIRVKVESEQFYLEPLWL